MLSLITPALSREQGEVYLLKNCLTFQLAKHGVDTC
jgi:hypothetical protein